jgi:hypothetical protein
LSHQYRLIVYRLIQKIPSQDPIVPVPTQGEFASKVPIQEEFASKVPIPGEFGSKVPIQEEFASKVLTQGEFGSKVPTVHQFLNPWHLLTRRLTLQMFNWGF